MSRTRNLLALLLGAAGLVLETQPAWAWDGPQTMVPDAIDVTDGSNYGFRVCGPMCGGVADFDCLLSTDCN
jgi:hypothetical protein